VAAAAAGSAEKLCAVCMGCWRHGTQTVADSLESAVGCKGSSTRLALPSLLCRCIRHSQRAHAAAATHWQPRSCLHCGTLRDGAAVACGEEQRQPT
jgi:hypothetical protein